MLTIADLVVTTHARTYGRAKDLAEGAVGEYRTAKVFAAVHRLSEMTYQRVPESEVSRSRDSSGTAQKSTGLLYRHLLSFRDHVCVDSRWFVLGGNVVRVLSYRLGNKRGC